MVSENGLKGKVQSARGLRACQDAIREGTTREAGSSFLGCACSSLPTEPPRNTSTTRSNRDETHDTHLGGGGGGGGEAILGGVPRRDPSALLPLPSLGAGGLLEATEASADRPGSWIEAWLPCLCAV